MYSIQSWPLGTCCEIQSSGAGLHGAVPVGTKAEELAVEVVFVGAAMHEVAHVDDVVADGVGGDGLAAAGLEELHGVAFGVLGVEPVAAVGGGVELGEVSDVVRAEIAAESGGIGGGVGDAGHAADAVVGGEGKDFDELGGAEVVAGAGGILRVCGLGGAEDVVVEVVRGSEIVCVDAHVGDAGDGRPLLGDGAERRKESDEEETKSLVPRES